jgi:hypothetical protein
VKPGYVGAFFAKKGAGTLEYDKFKTEVLDLLQKAKLLAK